MRKMTVLTLLLTSLFASADMPKWASDEDFNCNNPVPLLDCEIKAGYDKTKDPIRKINPHIIDNADGTFSYRNIGTETEIRAEQDMIFRGSNLLLSDASIARNDITGSFRGRPNAARHLSNYVTITGKATNAVVFAKYSAENSTGSIQINRFERCTSTEDKCSGKDDPVGELMHQVNESIGPKSPIFRRIGSRLPQGRVGQEYFSGTVASNFASQDLENQNFEHISQDVFVALVALVMSELSTDNGYVGIYKYDTRIDSRRNYFQKSNEVNVYAGIKWYAAAPAEIVAKDFLKLVGVCFNKDGGIGADDIVEDIDPYGRTTIDCVGRDAKNYYLRDGHRAKSTFQFIAMSGGDVTDAFSVQAIFQKKGVDLGTTFDVPLRQNPGSSSFNPDLQYSRAIYDVRASENAYDPNPLYKMVPLRAEQDQAVNGSQPDFAKMAAELVMNPGGGASEAPGDAALTSKISLRTSDYGRFVLARTVKDGTASPLDSNCLTNDPACLKLYSSTPQ